ncbi:hypothetical protein SY89_00932 [Halolamina pelagica]|uniref:Uncharacterized protein n=1 Tax=Halolamina pelagica TaxID=699431 RepID=A0A0P7FTT9_9EURY|nr:hypothetical protein SY89_00932 [Halolamina pelagica]
MEYEEPKFFEVMGYVGDAERDVIDMVSGNPDWEPPQALREGLQEYATFEPDRFQYPPATAPRRSKPRSPSAAASTPAGSSSPTAPGRRTTWAWRRRWNETPGTRCS